MKITSVKAVPASSSPQGRPPRNYMFVKIETDEGITGWGEATAGPLSVATQIDEVGQVLVGEDPWQIEKHWQTLYHHFFVRGGVVQMSAISGIEIALWDIKGQAVGLPIYEMLGGKMRDRIWCYGRWDGPTPEGAAETAMNNVSNGLTALKGDPFDHCGLFIPAEAERVAIKKLEAVRKAVGDDVELLVEVHGRLAPGRRHPNRQCDGRLSALCVRRTRATNKPRRNAKSCRGRKHPTGDWRAALHQVGIYRLAEPTNCEDGSTRYCPGWRYIGVEEDCGDGGSPLCRFPTTQSLRSAMHDRVFASRRLHPKFYDSGRRHQPVVSGRLHRRFPGSEGWLSADSDRPRAGRGYERSVAQGKPLA